MSLCRTLLLLICLGASLPLSASAATSAKTKSAVGIKVAPYLQSVSIASFESSKTFTVKVTNHTTSTRSFNVSVADFGASGDFGGVAFLGLKDSDYATQHGLSAWITLSPQTFTLKADQAQTIMGSIRNDTKLQPGGHYGAVLINEVDGSASSSKNTVTTNPTVSALIFATKLGGEQYDIHLDHVSSDGNWLHLPQTVDVRFENPGNVAVVPRGTVQLKNSHGTIISQGAINEDSAYILPLAYRQLYTPVAHIAAAGWWPQRFTLQVNYRYDGTEQIGVYKTTFYFMNAEHLAIVALAVGVLCAVGVYGYRQRLWITLPKIHRF